MARYKLKKNCFTLHEDIDDFFFDFTAAQSRVNKHTGRHYKPRSPSHTICCIDLSIYLFCILYYK